VAGLAFTAEQYCEDVLGGRVVANRWVRLACERHRRDLVEGAGRGLWFDQTAARVAVAFFGLLQHSKGEWAGTAVRLEPWQQFHLSLLFGWKRADGLRRFRTFYLEVARKNGKTTEAAGVGLFLLTADGEAGAEVYAAATKRDQARILHSEASRMVLSSRPLAQAVTKYRDNLHVKGTASKFEPLGRDADSLDGLNVHGAIVDELHAHTNRDLWDVLDTATGARRQPIMFAITTAGYNRQSLCYEMHEYTKKVLGGEVVDDSFLGLIYAIDEGDDWQDERVWVKANPNLGGEQKH
jgi:phage terminase large subunit-like protein